MRTEIAAENVLIVLISSDSQALKVLIVYGG